MRRLLSFRCGETELAATVEGAEGETGLLLVTGGSQTRVGSHRMYERLSKALSQEGFPCFRYDRRGVGDSGGEDPGYLDSGPDIAAAAQAFRDAAQQVRRIFGFGLCDGASALALHGDQAGLDGIILVNPWLVEAEAGAPPPAAIKQHYRKRLLSGEGWKKLLSGQVDYWKLLKGMTKIASPKRDRSLAARIASALQQHGLPAEVILATGDATAIAASAELNAATFRGRIRQIDRIESDSHTFARTGDEEALFAATSAALRRLNSQKA
jgi:exosortase A-associated hydrolase 1